MKREQVLARLLRAVSGKSHRQVAEELEVDPSKRREATRRQPLAYRF